MNTLTSLLAEEDNNLVEDAWHALKGLTSRIPKEQLPQYVSSAREAIGTAKASSFGPFKVFLCSSVEVSMPRFERNRWLRVSQEKQRRRQRLSALHSHGILVRGFCFEKGLAPVVDIFIQVRLNEGFFCFHFFPSDVRSTRPLTFYSPPQGMLYSSHPEERQSAADGLKELLLTATPEAVKAHVTSITGKQNE